MLADVKTSLDTIGIPSPYMWSNARFMAYEHSAGKTFPASILERDTPVCLGMFDFLWYLSPAKFKPAKNF